MGYSYLINLTKEFIMESRLLQERASRRLTTREKCHLVAGALLGLVQGSLISGAVGALTVDKIAEEFGWIPRNDPPSSYFFLGLALAEIYHFILKLGATPLREDDLPDPDESRQSHQIRVKKGKEEPIAALEAVCRGLDRDDTSGDYRPLRESERVALILGAIIGIGKEGIVNIAGFALACYALFQNIVHDPAKLSTIFKIALGFSVVHEFDKILAGPSLTTRDLPLPNSRRRFMRNLALATLHPLTALAIGCFSSRRLLQMNIESEGDSQSEAFFSDLGSRSPVHGLAAFMEETPDRAPSSNRSLASIQEIPTRRSASPVIEPATARQVSPERPPSPARPGSPARSESSVSSSGERKSPAKRSFRYNADSEPGAAPADVHTNLLSRSRVLSYQAVAFFRHNVEYEEKYGPAAATVPTPEAKNATPAGPARQGFDPTN